MPPPNCHTRRATDPLRPDKIWLGFANRGEVATLFQCQCNSIIEMKDNQRS
jgi:hypothetical protein